MVPNLILDIEKICSYFEKHFMPHSFITSLERAGISPKMAQTLARHGDIRLTIAFEWAGLLVNYGAIVVSRTSIRIAR